MNKIDTGGRSDTRISLGVALNGESNKVSRSIHTHELLQCHVWKIGLVEDSNTNHYLN